MKRQKSAGGRVGVTLRQPELLHGGFAEAGVIGDLALAQNAPTVRAMPQALAALAKHGYSQDEIHMLVIPKRTLARRTANREPLTVEETDKAMRLARLASLAERVFGDREKANRWMRKPKHQLGGETPVAFLSSESGARVVEDMLYRIEHGILA
jgi:putative toxin-antitoxin system antitoxin component (TIGR02293 family)